MNAWMKCTDIYKIYMFTEISLRTGTIKGK